jgi:hypothetical protein
MKTAEECRRIMLYGTCEVCSGALDVRTIRQPDGSLLREMFCPDCEAEGEL